MNKLLICVLLAATACGGKSKSSASPTPDTKASSSGLGSTGGATYGGNLYGGVPSPK